MLSKRMKLQECKADRSLVDFNASNFRINVLKFSEADVYPEIPDLFPGCDLSPR